MRVFGIEPDGTFREYVETPFQDQHQEVDLENWLEANPDGILEDGKLLIIGRQVRTNLDCIIDLLAIDRHGDLVVIELKRHRTPRETLAQSLEYASFAEQLDVEQLDTILQTYLNDASLTIAEHHREYFEISPDEAVSFNKDQRLVIVAQTITREIRQTASFLRAKSVRVTCVEFSYFRSSNDTRLLTQNIVVGNESARPVQVTSGSLPITSESEFVRSLDQFGKPVFEKLLNFARQNSLPIHWGTKGFSINVDLDGNHVAFCYGYPGDSVYRQSIYTGLMGRGGIVTKTAFPEEAMEIMLVEGQATGLLQPAGRELKCVINRALSDQELTILLEWFGKMAENIREYGLKE